MWHHLHEPLTRTEAILSAAPHKLASGKIHHNQCLWAYNHYIKSVNKTISSFNIRNNQVLSTLKTLFDFYFVICEMRGSAQSSAQQRNAVKMCMCMYMYKIMAGEGRSRSVLHSQTSSQSQKKWQSLLFRHSPPIWIYKVPPLPPSASLLISN